MVSPSKLLSSTPRSERTSLYVAHLSGALRERRSLQLEQICGSISNYNTSEPYNVKNLQNLVWREITFHGFLIASLMPKYAPEFFRTFPARVASGEIKYKEHRVEGLENAGQALVDVLKGKNFGKMVVVVANEPASRGRPPVASYR